MKIASIVIICLGVAGCSQTSVQENAPEPSSRKVTTAKRQAAAVKSDDPCRDAMKAQTDAAMLGGALGMVGSFGAFGGRGGMVASHLASTAGNVVATSQTANARAGMERECL